MAVADAVALWKPAPVTFSRRHASSTAASTLARASRSTRSVAAENDRSAAYVTAPSVGTYSRCTGDRRAICAASSASCFTAAGLVSLPVATPRRCPTHTVAVTVTLSERPLVVMRLSANRACDAWALCTLTMASSAPAAFAWPSRVSQVASASSRDIMIRYPC